MSFSVIKPGTYDTLQDKGRLLMADAGIPQSGAMDTYLMGMANLLLGNSASATCLEVFSSGPRLRFHQNTRIAITALDANVHLNQRKIDINKAITVDKDDELHIKQVVQGNFAYVAFLGDIDTEVIAGSRSFHSSITRHQRFEKGMHFPIDQSTITTFDRSRSHIRIDTDGYTSSDIRAFKGPEFDKLSADAQYQLFHNEWQLSNNMTRMGFQLKDRIHHELGDILTAPVFPGTVQLNHAGDLMVLMKDAQTTGGYPRVLQVMDEDLNRFAQKQAGSPIRFELID